MMNFNVYFVMVPVFLLLAFLFGSYNMKKLPMAICGFVAAVTTVFLLAAESFMGIVQLFVIINGFDSHPIYGRFSAVFSIIVVGIIVGVSFYKIATRNSKKAKAKARRQERTNYGEFNEMVYGKTCTPVELVEVLC